MDPLSFTVPDWKSRLIKHQYVEPTYHQLSHNRLVYGDRSYSQYKTAFGFGMLPLATKLSFIYLAGLMYAKKQFIPGYFYFTNAHFNWVGASKYLIAGYLVGEFFSIFSFGQPFLVEDLFRRKYRALTTVPKMEHGTLNR